jgi:hypothetical protein
MIIQSADGKIPHAIALKVANGSCLLKNYFSLLH